MWVSVASNRKILAQHMCSLHQWDPRCPQASSELDFSGGEVGSRPSKRKWGRGKRVVPQTGQTCGLFFHILGQGQAGKPSAGQHLTDLQGLCLPSFKTKERAWRQQRSYQWFNGLMDGGAYMSEQGLAETPHRACSTTGRTWQQSAPGGKGRLPVIGELTSGGFISHQRNHPSDKNSH